MMKVIKMGKTNLVLNFSISFTEKQQVELILQNVILDIEKTTF